MKLPGTKYCWREMTQRTIICKPHSNLPSRRSVGGRAVAALHAGVGPHTKFLCLAGIFSRDGCKFLNKIAGIGTLTLPIRGKEHNNIKIAVGYALDMGGILVFGVPAVITSTVRAAAGVFWPAAALKHGKLGNNNDDRRRPAIDGVFAFWDVIEAVEKKPLVRKAKRSESTSVNPPDIY